MPRTASKPDLISQIRKQSSQIKSLQRQMKDVAHYPILADSISTGQLVADSVTANEIAVGTITATEIATGTIVAGNIAAGTITGTLIAAHTIYAGNIAAGTIGASEIAANSITSTLILAQGIVAASLYAGAVHADRIHATNIAAATITGTEIAATTITATNIAVGAITATQIQAASITADRLSVTSIADIASGTLGNITLSAGGYLRTSGAASKIQFDQNGIKGYDSGGVTKFNLDPTTGIVTAVAILQTGSQVPAPVLTGTITSTQIGANQITTALIAANAITTTEILAGTIVGSDIAAATITTTQIAANTITTTNLAATAIDAMTITGAIFRTSASNPKVQMDSTGLTFVDASAVATVELSTSSAGLRLVAGTTGTPPSERRVRWVQPSNLANTVGEIISYIDGTPTRWLELRTTRLSGDGGVRTAIEAIDSTVANHDANMQVITSGALCGGYLFAGLKSYTVGDNSGQSSFVQNAFLGDRKISRGTAVLTWAGSQFASATIAHGLGVTPGVVFLNPRGGGINIVIPYTNDPYNSTNFVANAMTWNGAGAAGSITFDWIAMT